MRKPSREERDVNRMFNDECQDCIGNAESENDDKTTVYTYSDNASWVMALSVITSGDVNGGTQRFGLLVDLSCLDVRGFLKVFMEVVLYEGQVEPRTKSVPSRTRKGIR